MRYLIVMPGHPPFYTQDFDPASHYSPGMTVIDIQNSLYFDGHGWVDIQFDEL